jgi:hypothetical protein
MIRVIVGFILVFGAVGGMDNATDAQLLPLVAIAAVGLVSMFFGVQKVNK